MRTLCVGLLLLGLFAGRPASATVVLQLDLPQLVGRADIIFVGKVEKLQSHWSEDHRHIVTDATIRVTRGVKGTAAGQTVVVRSLGGTVDGIGMQVAGSPQLRTGEELLLFTDQRKGHRYITGMSQGLYRVRREASGQIMVQNLRGGATIAKQTPSGLKLLREEPAALQPLESFVRAIQDTVALCAKEKSRCQER